MEKKRIMIYALAVLAALVVVFLPGFSELQKLREENRELQKRIRLLEKSNEDLKQEIHRTKNDPEYVEKKAREKLGIVKKGEVIYKGSDGR